MEPKKRNRAGAFVNEKDKYQCKECGENFRLKWNLNNHKCKIIRLPSRAWCKRCKRVTRRDINYKCEICK